MRVYGNDHTTIQGNVLSIDQSALNVKFTTKERSYNIPKMFVHNFEKKNGTQKLEIDTWYLKKQRIIPLNGVFAN